MAKSYCPCHTCEDQNCDDCVTCDICYAQSHCVDDAEDNEAGDDCVRIKR